MDIMDLATAWRNTHSLSFMPITFTQVVSAAGTVFVLAALQTIAGPRIVARQLEEARAMTETAIRFLREIGNTFSSAAGIAQILRGLLDHQIQDRYICRGGESPPHAYDEPAGAYIPQGFAQSPAAPMFQFGFGFGDALGGAPSYGAGTGAGLGTGSGQEDWCGGAQDASALAMYGGEQHLAYYASEGPPMQLEPPCSEEYVLNALSYI
jgi:hypothetical protein